MKQSPRTELNGFVEAVPDALLVVDSSGRIVEMNEEGAGMFGYACEELLGQPVEVLVPEAFRAVHEAHRARYAEEPTRRPMGKRPAYHARRRDGREFPVDIMLMPWSANGEKLVLASVRDITHLLQADAQVQTSERRFRALVEKAFEDIILLDAGGRIIYESPHSHPMLGFEPGEMTAHSGFELLHPDELPAAKEAFRELLAQPGASMEREFRMRHKDGSWNWVHFIATNLLDDPAVGAVVLNLRNINPRKQAEEALARLNATLEERVAERTRELREGEQRLRQLSQAVEQSPANVVITDPMGNIQYVNPTFTRLTGYSLGEALGKNPRILKSGHTSTEEYRRLWETITSGRVWRGEFLNRKKNGETYWEAAAIAPVTDQDGTITNYVAVKEDITERKRAAEELSRNQAELLEAQRIAGLGSWHWDPATDMVSVSDELARMFSLPPGTQMPFTQMRGRLFPEADWDRINQAAQQALLTGAGYEMEVRAIMAGGDGWVVTRAGAVRGPDGTVTGLRGTMQDITGRRQAEETIAAEQERLKFIFSGVEVGIALRTTHPDGTVTRTINDAHERISGVSRERDHEPLPYINVTHPDDNVVQQRFMERLLAGEIDHYSMVKRYIHPGGRIVWADLVFRRRILPDGTIEDLATLVDITARKQAEEALVFERAKLEAALECLPVGVGISNPDGTMFSMNREGLRIHAFDPAGKMLARPEEYARSFELRHPDGRVMPQEEWPAARAMRGEFVVDYEVLLLKKGSPGQRIVSFTVEPVRNSRHELSLMIFLMRDVTRRKQAEEALRASEERFRNVFEHAGMGIAISSLDGRFVDCNPSYCKITGYAEDELLGKVSSSLVHPEDREEDERLVGRLAAGEIPSFGIENRYVCKTGEPVWVRKFITFLRNDRGQPTHFIALVTNITSLIIRDAALERQAGLLHLAHDAIIVWHTEGGIEFWNKGATDLYGYHASEVRGRITHDLLKTAHPFAWSHIEAELRDRGFWEGEVGHVTKAGERVIVDSRLQLMPGNGGGMLILETNRDVTDRRRLEREIIEISERERKRFGEELHDDLGQQLTGVMMMAGVLSHDLRKHSPGGASDLEKLLDMLRHAMKSTRRMARGLYPTELEDGDLVIAIEGLVNTVSAAGIRCKYEHDPECELRDPECAIHLYRIVQEALNNAIKHASPSEITVACARAGGRFTITVTNDGNPFKVPAKKKQGMGLSLLRHRAHLLGGEVTFEPLAAGGCRMVCDIPEPVPRNHKNGNTATTHRPGGEGDGG